MKYLTTIIILVVGVFFAATVAAQGDPCTQEPEIMTTDDGVEFVRTPDACFENLPDWPYEPHYVEIDGLRQAYVDFGSGESGETILLLHGQPSWSYLYRKMIPVLADAGHRVIAMDHLGMGRSDKPIDPDYYTYLGHTERLEAFIQELELEQDNLTIFVQDWGSLIGLYVVGTNPDWFDRVVVGNGFLLPLQEGQNAFEYPEDIEASNAVFHENLLNSPAQQPPIRDEDGNLLVEQYGGAEAGFGAWAAYARYSEDFMPSLIVEASTYFPLTDEEEAAYDAPFPSRITMGGPRAFPSLANQLGGVTMPAFMGLMQYDRPLLTIWGNNDQGNLGDPQLQQTLIERVPGAAGWDHVRLQEASHFLQDDQGEEIARRVNEFIAQSSGETAVSGETVQMYGVEVSVLDRGARWLATGIEEIDAVEGLSELDRATLHTHLVTLIENSGLRHDEAYHADFVSELEAQEFPAEAIEIVERAFVRVSSPLNYHEGYWVSETEVEGVPVPVAMINDIHIDAYAGTVTVYGQVQVQGTIIAPVQAGPGEEALHFSGNMLGMHPNAVYLNGSGEELTEADGTGSWWVKHPIMGPEGYYNWTAMISDYSFGGQYTEGYLLEDGVTMMLRSFFEDDIRGFPVDNDAIADEVYGNSRTPGFETDAITHELVRYEPANVDPEAGPVDYTSTAQDTIVFECRVEPSAFDGLARNCPTMDNQEDTQPIVPGPNDTGLYTTVNPSEHADDGRSHVFEYATFGGSLDEDATNQAVVRTAPGFYPGAYNVVTRNENEIFVYYGVYGEVEGATGPAVARLDADTLEEVWNTQLAVLENETAWNYPGVIGMHGNGTLIVVSGNTAAVIDPDTGQIINQVDLPQDDPALGSYNGFVTTSDGTLFTKALFRNCDAEGSIALGRCQDTDATQTLLALDPVTLEIIDQVELPDYSVGRVPAAVHDGVDYVYMPGNDLVYRYRWENQSLTLDEEWGFVQVTEEGDAGAVAPNVIGNWVFVGVNTLSSRPMPVYAISAQDSSRRYVIQPFADISTRFSFAVAHSAFDPVSGLLITADTGTGYIAGTRFDPESGFEVVWQEEQITSVFMQLIGTPEERVMVTSELTNFPAGPRTPLNTLSAANEQVVFRDAATGRELARTENLPRMTQGSNISPGFNGRVYFIGVDGVLYEVTVQGE